MVGAALVTKERRSLTMAKKEFPLARAEMNILRDLAIRAVPMRINLVTDERMFAWRALAEALVEKGLVTAHRSSIGMLEEKATYSIAPMGGEVLADADTKNQGVTP